MFGWNDEVNDYIDNDNEAEALADLTITNSYTGEVVGIIKAEDIDAAMALESVFWTKGQDVEESFNKILEHLAKEVITAN